MKTLLRAAGVLAPLLGRQGLAAVLSFALLFITLPANTFGQDTQNPQAPTVQQPPTAPQAPPYVTQTPEQLQDLVAPIALYPDSLVAQILAASTFPEQVVEADRYVQAHPDLKGKALADAVNDMPWDDAVKALTAFPDVLGNMDKNLSWTSSLGDAYYNQPQDVMDAVQVMRHKAEAAGTLKSTSQQNVTTQGSTIVIQPAQPDVVYVPAYDPWLVYGPPIYAWPGWYPYPGIWFGGGPFLSFGIGFGIGFFGGFGWGWPHWGFNWYNHRILFHGSPWYSRSATFYNRNAFYHGRGVAPGRGFGGRAGVFNHPGASPRPFEGNQNASRGFAPSRGESGLHSGAFSGYGHGGDSRSFSARGGMSMGGFHGGGFGGFHGGGFGGGGFHGGGGGHH